MIWRIINFYQQMKSMLWFVPAVLCVATIALALGLFRLETSIFPDFFDELPFLYQGSVEDAKKILVVLLSSMITMTTLVVSVTIVLLSLASTQLGPRLIKYFMSDTKTKIYIGLFFSSIVSCFVVLWVLYDAAELSDAPSLSISYVSLYCFFNLFVLLFFVHHVAESCIADNIVVAVSKDLMQSIDKLQSRADGVSQDLRITNGLPHDFEGRAAALTLPKNGYVQAIDTDGLLEFAQKKDLTIDIAVKVGEYAIKGQNGVLAYPAENVDDKTQKAIFSSVIQGAQRTPTQDIEYSLRHLVEMALRALSPGVNDPYTAITVIDHLFMAMASLLRRRKGPCCFYDKSNRLRLRIRRSGDADLIDAICAQIRRAGRDRADITLHLLRKILDISTVTAEESQKNALVLQVQIIKDGLQKENFAKQDYEKIYDECRKTLQELSEQHDRS